MVTFLLDQATKDDKVNLYGYTFDHPNISRGLVNAALRGASVEIVLNDEEVEGKSGTRHAVAAIKEMVDACNSAGCGPDCGSACNLEIWSQHGQLLGPVYRKWGRPINSATADKCGCLHAKVFAIGPKAFTAEDDDSKILILGSTNWTVSSEANMELDVVLEIEKDGTATLEAVLQDMRTAGSRLRSSAMVTDMSVLAGRRRG